MGCLCGKPRAAVLAQIDFGEKAAQLAKADEARASDERVAREAVAARRHDRAERLHGMYEIDARVLTDRLEAFLVSNAEVATLENAPGRRGYHLGAFSDRGGDVDTFVCVHLAPRVAPFEVLFASLGEHCACCCCVPVQMYRMYAALSIASNPLTLEPVDRADEMLCSNITLRYSVER